MNLASGIQDLVHLFFPQVCPGCGSDLPFGKHPICLRCITALPSTHFFELPGNPVEKKFYGRLHLQNAASAWYFTKHSLLQHLIHRLKYRGDQNLGLYMGRLMGEMISASHHYSGIDIIIPLPLNKRRERSRGYNQAATISRGIASSWPRPVIEDAVVRKTYTETQTHYGRLSRWKNMDGVFDVSDPEKIAGKHILLVDDVVTTGASLEACGGEILKVEGTSLSVATLAFTI